MNVLRAIGVGWLTLTGAMTIALAIGRFGNGATSGTLIYETKPHLRFLEDGAQSWEEIPVSPDRPVRIEACGRFSGDSDRFAFWTLYVLARQARTMFFITIGRPQTSMLSDSGYGRLSRTALPNGAMNCLSVVIRADHQAEATLNGLPAWKGGFVPEGELSIHLSAQAPRTYGLITWSHVAVYLLPTPEP